VGEVGQALALALQEVVQRARAGLEGLDALLDLPAGLDQGRPGVGLEPALHAGGVRVAVGAGGVELDLESLALLEEADDEIDVAVGVALGGVPLVQVGVVADGLQVEGGAKGGGGDGFAVDGAGEGARGDAEGAARGGRREGGRRRESRGERRRVSDGRARRDGRPPRRPGDVSGPPTTADGINGSHISEVRKERHRRPR